MVRILVFLLLVLCLSCSNKQHCKPGAPQNIMTTRLDNNGSTSYQHSILIEGLSKDCDSITVMSTVKNYLENNNSDTPISSVAVFNSTEHYDPSETLSQPKEFYGNCVVEIWFDQTSGRPREFVFFDNNGNRDYEGGRWKP